MPLLLTHTARFQVGRRTRRETRGRTQEQRATRVGVPREELPMRLRGARTNPTIDTRQRRAEARKGEVGTLVE